MGNTKQGRENVPLHPHYSTRRWKHNSQTMTKNAPSHSRTGRVINLQTFFDQLPCQFDLFVNNGMVHIRVDAFGHFRPQRREQG